SLHPLWLGAHLRDATFDVRLPPSSEVRLMPTAAPFQRPVRSGWPSGVRGVETAAEDPESTTWADDGRARQAVIATIVAKPNRKNGCVMFSSPRWTNCRSDPRTTL